MLYFQPDVSGRRSISWRWYRNIASLSPPRTELPHVCFLLPSIPFLEIMHTVVLFPKRAKSKTLIGKKQAKSVQRCRMGLAIPKQIIRAQTATTSYQFELDFVVEYLSLCRIFRRFCDKTGHFTALMLPAKVIILLADCMNSQTKRNMHVCKYKPRMH